MHSHTRLFTAGSFDVKLNHLLIIGVLVLAFSLSFLIRSQPADYGNELMEFDPFFNFRATEYIVENGFTEYFEWHDDKSWYPNFKEAMDGLEEMFLPLPKLCFILQQLLLIKYLEEIQVYMISLYYFQQ